MIIMSGLLTFTLAGVGFLLISILDSPLLPPIRNLPSLRSLSLLLLSSLFLLHSLVSSLSSSSSAADPLGPALPLSSAAAAVPLLLHSLSSLLHPTPLLPLLRAAASLSPLLLLSLRRRDPDAIESRYFDLLRVPLLLSLLSAFVSPSSPSRLRALLRSFALALLGTWLIQMGLSLFCPLAIARGCHLHRRGGPSNYSVWCKGHPEFHRARAIATLQFNCHLALMVVLAVGVYSLGIAKNSEREYRPLELARFSLADDEEDGLKDGDVADTEMKNAR